jgi:uncharacterized integral membrane protein
VTGKDPARPARASESRLVPRLVAAAVLTVLAVVFIAQNNQQVDIRLLVPLVTMPLWVALASMLVAGAAIGYAVSWRRR